MVIGELPVGSILRFGRYKMGHITHSIDIDWIKASKDNFFISEKVLLGTKYDEMESNWATNSNYLLSNIRQFMNSDALRWFHPTHQYDKQTDYIYLDSGFTIRMARYQGLLYDFEEHELASFEPFEDGDYLRLPTEREISGGFQYFQKHGKRARPTDEYGNLERKNYRPGMYASYYVYNDDSSGMVTEMTRGGSFISIHPIQYSGVRPVCRIKDYLEVTHVAENTYQINYPEVTNAKYFDETNTIDWLLGI